MCLQIQGRAKAKYSLYCNQIETEIEQTCPVHMNGSLKRTYSSSLLYIPTALLVGVPSSSLVNSSVDMLSNSLARCLQTLGLKSKRDK